MAAGPVTAKQYPDATLFELQSELGAPAAFFGWVDREGDPCAACGTGDTVSVYRGPQNGLAFDVPRNPFEVDEIELEFSWCSRHGFAGMRLVGPCGAEHADL